MPASTPFAKDRDAHPEGMQVAGPIEAGVRVSLCSLTGTHHAVNQDTLVHQPGGLSGVADGVGGGAHGEVASTLLLEQLSLSLPTSEAQAWQRLQDIDRHIAQTLAAMGDGPGASVFASVWPLAQPGCWQALWVGDCQIAHYRRHRMGWRLLWQSEAQTYENCQQPAPAQVDPQSPASMVGCGMALPPRWQRLSVKPGDRLVLSSDGFHRHVNTTEVAGLMQRAGAALPMNTADHWCQRARKHDNPDDISVLILEIGGPARPWLNGLLITLGLIALGILGALMTQAWRGS